MDSLCHVWTITCLGRSADMFGQGEQDQHVLSIRGRKRVVLCGWDHPCPRSERQPSFLQIHLSDHSVPKTDELLLGVACEMRREQVHSMWQVS